jgi:hypothetical protein
VSLDTFQPIRDPTYLLAVTFYETSSDTRLTRVQMTVSATCARRRWTCSASASTYVRKHKASNSNITCHKYLHIRNRQHDLCKGRTARVRANLENPGTSPTPTIASLNDVSHMNGVTPEQKTKSAESAPRKIPVFLEFHLGFNFQETFEHNITNRKVLY